MKLKVPFKFGIVLIQREIEFKFNIAALEYATETVLDCDLWEVSKQDPARLNIAILYGAYVQACRERYRKPSFTEATAAMWMTYMSKDTQTEFLKGLQELLGKYSGKEPEEKKK